MKPSVWSNKKDWSSSVRDSNSSDTPSDSVYQHLDSKSNVDHGVGKMKPSQQHYRGSKFSSESDEDEGKFERKRSQKGQGVFSKHGNSKWYYHHNNNSHNSKGHFFKHQEINMGESKANNLPNHGLQSVNFRLNIFQFSEQTAGWTSTYTLPLCVPVTIDQSTSLANLLLGYLLCYNLYLSPKDKIFYISQEKDVEIVTIRDLVHLYQSLDPAKCEDFKLTLSLSECPSRPISLYPHLIAPSSSLNADSDCSQVTSELDQMTLKNQASDASKSGIQESEVKSEQLAQGEISTSSDPDSRLLEGQESNSQMEGCLDSAHNNTSPMETLYPNLSAIDYNQLQMFQANPGLMPFALGGLPLGVMFPPCQLNGNYSQSFGVNGPVQSGYSPLNANSCNNYQHPATAAVAGGNFMHPETGLYPAPPGSPLKALPWKGYPVPNRMGFVPFQLKRFDGYTKWDRPCRDFPSCRMGDRCRFLHWK